jgi:hypothetical protein
MEKLRVYSVENYLIEIDETKPFGSMGTQTYTWKWEVTIAKHDNIYKGMAIERNKHMTIPWCELIEMSPTEEMKKVCLSYMERVNS